jgi:hypothetical protein
MGSFGFPQLLTFVTTDRCEEGSPRLVHDGEAVSHVTQALRVSHVGAVSDSTAGVATVT